MNWEDKVQLKWALLMILWLQAFTLFLLFYRFYIRHDEVARRPSSSRLEKLSNKGVSVLEKLEDLMSRKASSRDPELIQLAKELLDPPAVTHPVKMSRDVYKTPQAEALDVYLNGKTGGFFVEAGGYDGETLSNSIYFELRKNWTGLLIEADPFFYTQLLGKNRRCWSINACLSPHDYASKLTFKESRKGHGRLVLNRKETVKNNDLIVPCFPLETILLALDRKKVDFFSLDVEGVELDMLKTIDFGAVDIQTIAVEFKEKEKAEFKSFMKDQGYSVYQEINVSDHTDFKFVNDFIFVKDNAAAFENEQ